MAQRGQQPGGGYQRVSPIKPGLRGASRLVQSRLHAQWRSATLSPRSFMKSVGAVLLAFLALCFVALWLGGQLSTVGERLTTFKENRLMAMGFTVQRIDVMGEGRLNEADVRAAVGIYEGDYFFGADLKRAQARTESLPWVDRAVVRRLWPNRIVVQLVETKPYAIYQENGALHLAAMNGDIVAPLDPEAGRLPEGLRIFTGPDATIHAADVTETLQSYPAIWDRTEGLTRQMSGRWDLHLAGDVTLRLPEASVETALARAQVLDRQAGLLSGRYRIVDLRLDDRIHLTPMVPAKT